MIYQPRILGMTGWRELEFGMLFVFFGRKFDSSVLGIDK